MLRRFFGKGRDERPRRSPAEHAWEIGVGGFMKFGLLAPPEGLAEADVVVKAVHALHLDEGHIRRVLEAEVVGLGPLAIWKGDGGRLAVARPALVTVMEQAFGRKKLRKLVEGDGFSLAAKRTPPGFGGWLSGKTYRQEAAREAYRHECDPEETEIGSGLEGATAFDFYRLVSDERSHAVEIQVHDGGRTEARLVALLEERHVEEFLPGS